MTTTTTAGPTDIPDAPRGGAATWYEVLDLTSKATQADVQRAYERALDLVEGRTIGGYFLLDPLAVESARTDIEWAWAVLGDSARRAAYDVRLGNAPTLLPQPSEPVTEAEVPSTPPASKETSGKPRVVGLKFLKPIDDRRPAITFAPPKTDPGIRLPVPAAPIPASEGGLVATPTVLPQAMMPSPSPPITSSPTNLPVLATPDPSPGLFGLEGEVNGQLLKRLRETRGLSLEAMVEATKIRKPYLSAIEEQDFENLPARVYLRGFLMTIGRVLKVDKVKLADGYLAFVARYGK